VTRRTFAIDATLAVAALALTLGMLSARGFGIPAATSRPLDVLGVGLAMLSTLPLLGSRWAPVSVYLVTCAASLGLISLSYPLDVPFGPLVAVYSLAFVYSGGRVRWRRRAALVLANSFIPAVAVAYLVRGTHLREIAAPLIAWALVFLGVWIAADRTRLQQVRIADLEERAHLMAAEAEQERRLAAAEERTRIARELHDSAGHAINVILVQAGAARLLHERDPERSRQAIATIERVARDTVTEIDGLVRALREDDRGEIPAPSDPSAIEELLDQHRAAGLSIATELRGEPRTLSHSVGWATYRILQEALTNAARHGAGSAEVEVWYGPHELQITVANPTSVPHLATGGGHGIIGMRERATLLGGTLHTEVGRQQFRLSARLPRRKAAP
jgi:signal transduction histidine kinase